MNWFTRIFSRRREDPWAGYDEGPREPIEIDPFPPPAVGRPGFAVNATALERLTARGGAARTRHVPAQAFTPSQPVSSLERFAGRSALLDRVIRAIEDQQLHVIIYGDRGIGKTSLMRVVAELAKGARYIVHFTSCGEQSEFSETFRSVASQIRLLYDGSLDPGDEDVERGGTLADRLPAGDFTASQLTEVFEGISGTRVLIMLDEFDRAESPRFRASIAELIKNLSDRSIRVQIMIAGVASNLTDLIAHIPSIRRNIVGIAVPNMGEDEIRDMVAIACKNGGPAFRPAAVEALARVSAGLPYLAALIGQHAAIAAIEQQASEVDEDHLGVATDRAAVDILSRLSPLVIHSLRDESARDRDSLLWACAVDAIENDGLITTPELIARLSVERTALMKLVRPIDEDPLERWQFVEDGVSSYIWLADNSLRKL
ncbi:MAG: ATP-binding protein [Sphingopyxis sp.]|uniref:ATP-binding protein n=1 Tax=Sphingopyxis sp. TaxID=1908224 RepID=UPI002ABCBE44|nr:ATP-binding protein [Sphingopyxis sp.]MDZ3833681.1 ATP-binding protein [Sphingopyxis sp.]